jgi:ABC-type bacteriocin/lantibiotic exporter with double-glycine peptidase domain
LENTNQLNYNECGICVINTLIKHFYRHDIKHQLLNEANITDKGLSVYDFEEICSKHGIFTESFQVDNNELRMLETNKLFVALINRDGGMHYVICKKKKVINIDVIDSISGHKIISIEQFLKEFSGIIIFVNKNQANINIKDDKITIFKHINVSYLLTNLLLQALIIGLAVISANYLSLIIKNSLSNSSYRNCVIISFIFFIIFVSSSLSKYLSSLLSAKQIKNNYYTLTNSFLNCMKNKDSTFFNKVNKHYLYLVDHCIHAISTYNTIEISNFIASLSFSFILLIYIASIDAIFLFVCGGGILLLATIGFIEYKYKQKMLTRVVNNGTVNSSICTETIKYIETQHNAFILSDIISKFKTNYNEYINLYYKNTKFSGGVSLLSEIIEKILLIIIILISSYYFDTRFDNDVSKIILSISLITMFYSNISNIISFISMYTEYGKMNEIFHNIISIGNKKDGEHEFTEIESISINNQEIKNGAEINVDNFEKYLVKFYSDEKIKIKINNIEVKDIKNDWINNNIYILNKDQKINKNILLNNFNTNKELINFIKKTKFDICNINDEEIEKTQIINILACLRLKNKIIYFNDNMRYINKDIKKYITKNIVPIIKNNNFLICRKK